MTSLVVTDVAKTYPGDPPVDALVSVSMTAEPGERVAIVGRSGAGKSTLLNILGLLDNPSSGAYQLLGEETSVLTECKRDRLRAQHLGFVFQDSHVLSARTCRENVSLKLQILGIPRDERPTTISRVLEQVGLLHRAESPARHLSGGERQRLAVARAIAGSPSVLLADEPTGNLDSANADNILELFDREAERGVTVVVITHDDRISRWADRALQITSGELRGR